MASPTLSVVIPTRNEAENLAALWERLDRALQGIEAEVCIVDDSDDDSPERLRRLHEAHPERLRYLCREGEERRGGLATAVVAGLHLARGRFVCVMDADLQHPPERVPGMLEAAEAGADLVVASRYLPGGSAGGLAGGGRRLVSRGAGAAARLLFSEARRSTDPLSGFFLCRRSVLDGIEFRPVGFKILLELLVCVPGITVVDVPLDFQPRAAGASKATMRQGLLYLRHLRSLVFEVEGSARLWKFGVVGTSGLAIFLIGLGLLTGPLKIATALAFLPAFAVSFVWNACLNHLWTFADQRHVGVGPGWRGYALRAAVAGAVMYGVYLLTTLWMPPLAAGLLAAVVGMIVNGMLSRGAVHDSPAAWSRLALDQGVQAGLGRLAATLSADRAYLLPPRPAGEGGILPAGLVESAVRQRRALQVTMAASHRPQRRSNIEMTSLLVVPAVTGDSCVGVVVCERTAPQGFGAGDLETAMHAVSGLAGLIGDAGSGPAQDAQPAPHSGKAPGGAATPLR